MTSKSTNKQNRTKAPLCLYIIGIFLILVICLGFVVKGPILKHSIENHLSEIFGQPTNIESVDFSPFYPNIFSIHNITTDNGITIKQIYAEYKLDNILHFDFSPNFEELDIIDVILPDNFSPKKNFNITNIFAKKLWIKNLSYQDIKNISYKTEFFNLDKNTINKHVKNNQTIGQNNLISFVLNNKGEIALNKTKYKEYNIDDANIAFECVGSGCFLTYNIKTNQGTIKGNALLDKKEKTFTSRKLEISGLNLKPVTSLNDYKLIVPFVSVSQTDLNLSTGTIYGFTGVVTQPFSKFSTLNGYYNNLIFNGINLGTGTITSEYESINDKHDRALRYKIQSEFHEGTLTADFIKISNQTYFENISLNNIQMEVNDELLTQINNFSEEYYIKNFTCNDCEVISTDKQIPFHIREITLNINDLKKIDPKNKNNTKSFQHKYNDYFISDNTLSNISFKSFNSKGGALGFGEYVFYNTHLSGTFIDDRLSVVSEKALLRNSKGQFSLIYPLNPQSPLILNISSQNLDLSDIPMPIFNNIQGKFKTNIMLELFDFNGKDFNFDNSTIIGTIQSDVFTLDNFSIDTFTTKLNQNSSCTKIIEAYKSCQTSIDEIKNFKLNSNLVTGIGKIEATGKALSGEFNAIINFKKEFNKKQKLETSTSGFLSVQSEHIDAPQKYTIFGSCFNELFIPETAKTPTN